MYIKRHKYLSKTNWRIHDESPTQTVNVLGLIPLVTLSRHSSTDVHHARLWSSYPRKTKTKQKKRDYPRTSMNFCDPKIVVPAEEERFYADNLKS